MLLILGLILKCGVVPVPQLRADRFTVQIGTVTDGAVLVPQFGTGDSKSGTGTVTVTATSSRGAATALPIKENKCIVSNKSLASFEQIHSRISSHNP